MKLSENLKRIRKENNLSQEQLAEKLGVSRQAVSKWESNQSYPEMDKVLLICKLFNYNIDELMNENIKEIDENKQSKLNINKYIDDFFEFITKTVDMLSSMTFKQKIKCVIEQIMVGMLLLIVFGIVGSIGGHIVSGLFRMLSSDVYYVIMNVLQSIYTIFALILGTVIFLHIFKIRYLDYYEIIKEDTEFNNIENEAHNASKKTLNYSIKETDKEVKNDVSYIKSQDDNDEKIERYDEKRKIFIAKKKEKIIIRDPNHSNSRFLTGIFRLILSFVKFIVGFMALGFIVTFISLIVLLILSFLFIQTGFVFIGSFLCIIAAIIINFIILELAYDFIISKKYKRTRMAIFFLTSIILVGIGIGMILIGITDFNYIEDSNANNQIEEIYEYTMTDNLSVECWEHDIEYIEEDRENIKIIVKHSKYLKPVLMDENDEIELYCTQNEVNFFEAIRTTIKDINNKQIKNYYIPEVYVYASSDNIEKLKNNLEIKRRKNSEIENLNTLVEYLETEISGLNYKIRLLEDENLNLHNEISEHATTILELENQLY